MAKVTSKPAGGQKVSGGKGHMNPFSGSSKQKPGQTASTKGSPAKSFADKPDGGSGKMNKFAAVKAQSPGRTGQR